MASLGLAGAVAIQDRLGLSSGGASIIPSYDDNSERKESQVHLQDAMLRGTAHLVRGVLDTHSAGSTSLTRRAPKRQSLVVRKQVLVMLMEAADKLNTAQAQFEYRKALKERSYSFTKMNGKGAEVLTDILQDKSQPQEIQDLYDAQENMHWANQKAVQMGRRPVHKLPLRYLKLEEQILQFLASKAAQDRWGWFPALQHCVTESAVCHQHLGKRPSHSHVKFEGEGRPRRANELASSVDMLKTIIPVKEPADSEAESIHDVEDGTEPAPQLRWHYKGYGKRPEELPSNETWISILKRRRKDRRYQQLIAQCKRAMWEAERQQAARLIQHAWRTYKDGRYARADERLALMREQLEKRRQMQAAVRELAAEAWRQAGHQKPLPDPAVKSHATRSMSRKASRAASRKLGFGSSVKREVDAFPVLSSSRPLSQSTQRGASRVASGAPSRAVSRAASRAMSRAASRVVSRTGSRALSRAASHATACSNTSSKRLDDTWQDVLKTSRAQSFKVVDSVSRTHGTTAIATSEPNLEDRPTCASAAGQLSHSQGATPPIHHQQQQQQQQQSEAVLTAEQLHANTWDVASTADSDESDETSSSEYEIVTDAMELVQLVEQRQWDDQRSVEVVGVAADAPLDQRLLGGGEQLADKDTTPDSASNSCQGWVPTQVEVEAAVAVHELAPHVDCTVAPVPDSLLPSPAPARPHRVAAIMKASKGALEALTAAMEMVTGSRRRRLRAAWRLKNRVPKLPQYAFTLHSMLRLIEKQAKANARSVSQLSAAGQMAEESELPLPGPSPAGTGQQPVTQVEPELEDEQSPGHSAARGDDSSHLIELHIQHSTSKTGLNPSEQGSPRVSLGSSSQVDATPKETLGLPVSPRPKQPITSPIRANRVVKGTALSRGLAASGLKPEHGAHCLTSQEDPDWMRGASVRKQQVPAVHTRPQRPVPGKGQPNISARNAEVSEQSGVARLQSEVCTPSLDTAIALSGSQQQQQQQLGVSSSQASGVQVDAVVMSTTQNIVQAAQQLQVPSHGTAEAGWVSPGYEPSNATGSPGPGSRGSSQWIHSQAQGLESTQGISGGHIFAQKPGATGRAVNTADEPTAARPNTVYMKSRDARAGQHTSSGCVGEMTVYGNSSAAGGGRSLQQPSSTRLGTALAQGAMLMYNCLSEAQYDRYGGAAAGSTEWEAEELVRRAAQVQASQAAGRRRKTIYQSTRCEADSATPVGRGAPRLAVRVRHTGMLAGISVPVMTVERYRKRMEQQGIPALAIDSSRPSASRLEVRQQEAVQAQHAGEDGLAALGRAHQRSKVGLQNRCSVSSQQPSQQETDQVRVPISTEAQARVKVLMPARFGNGLRVAADRQLATLQSRRFRRARSRRLQDRLLFQAMQPVMNLLAKTQQLLQEHTLAGAGYARAQLSGPAPGSMHTTPLASRTPLGPLAPQIQGLMPAARQLAGGGSHLQPEPYNAHYLRLAQRYPVLLEVPRPSRTQPVDRTLLTWVASNPGGPSTLPSNVAMVKDTHVQAPAAQRSEHNACAQVENPEPQSLILSEPGDTSPRPHTTSVLVLSHPSFKERSVNPTPRPQPEADGPPAHVYVPRPPGRDPPASRVHTPLVSTSQQSPRASRALMPHRSRVPPPAPSAPSETDAERQSPAFAIEGIESVISPRSPSPTAKAQAIARGARGLGHPGGTDALPPLFVPLKGALLSPNQPRRKSIDAFTPGHQLMPTSNAVDVGPCLVARKLRGARGLPFSSDTGCWQVPRGCADTQLASPARATAEGAPCSPQCTGELGQVTGQALLIEGLRGPGALRGTQVKQTPSSAPVDFA